MPKHSSHILALARRGAEHRIREINAEIASLLEHFPHLRAGLGRGAPAAHDAAKHRSRSKMSPAARRAVSVRMKKYWAAKRKTAKR